MAIFLVDIFAHLEGVVSLFFLVFGLTGVSVCSGHQRSITQIFILIGITGLIIYGLLEILIGV